MSVRSQPGNHFYKIVLRHGRATCRRPVNATPDVKKDGAAGSGALGTPRGIVLELPSPHFNVSMGREGYQLRAADGRLMLHRVKCTLPRTAMGQQEPCRAPLRHGRRPSESGQNRCSAVNGECVPLSAVSTCSNVRVWMLIIRIPAYRPAVPLVDLLGPSQALRAPDAGVRLAGFPPLIPIRGVLVQ